MADTPRDRVLAALEERAVELPDDGLTPEKIEDRAFGFQFESENVVSFRIERHPTMYLSGGGLPGLDATPARFHVLTEYRLDLAAGTCQTEELDSSFEYEPWMVLEAELGDGPVGTAIRNEIETVQMADDPETAFEDAFRSWIDHWEEKFAEVDGRKVPEEDKQVIVDLLVGELRRRSGLD